MIHFKHALAFAAAALTLTAAQATTLVITGQIDSGPSLGQTFTGEFNYNDALVTGIDYELVDLSAWSFDAFGQTFTAAGATTAPQAAFYSGQFVGISADYNSPTLNFSLVDGFFDLNSAYLSYSTTAGNGFGSYVVTAAVPEPSSMALGAIGLLALYGSTRRRQRPSA